MVQLENPVHAKEIRTFTMSRPKGYHKVAWTNYTWEEGKTLTKVKQSD